MTARPGILNEFGRPYRGNGHGRRALAEVTTPAAHRQGRLEGTYDEALTTRHNAAHWVAADRLDADAANSLSVRKKIRERARYEVANNSYLKGIVLTAANHEVGTGPTLQIQTSSVGFNAMVEARFAQWAEAIDLPGKLRTMVQARQIDGEAFGILVSNPAAEGVQLDFRLVECDQVTSPYYSPKTQNYVDGITLDDLGNPVRYDILKVHPGASFIGEKFGEFDTLDARFVMHLFRADRPGQHRGTSELLPALSLFPALRRYTLATLAAAETAAGITVLLETDLAPGGEPDEIAPGSVEIPRGAMVQTPMGWKAKQIAAEHPNTMFEAFRREIVNEAARCLNMPYNIAACNSAQYNFASGRLDHQTYFAAVGVNQSHLARHVLQPLFRAWFAEAALVYGWQVPPSAIPAHAWCFVGQPYCDPEAEANAIRTRLASGMTTHPREFARLGLDVADEWQKGAEALGMTVEEYQALIRQTVFPAPKAF